MRNWVGFSALVVAFSFSLYSFAAGPELVDETKTRFNLEEIQCRNESKGLVLEAKTNHSSYSPGSITVHLQPSTKLVSEISYTDQWDETWKVRKDLHEDSKCVIEKLSINWVSESLNSVSLTLRCDKLYSQRESFSKGFSIESEIPCNTDRK